MAFKSIMVYVDMDEQSEERVGAAAELANRFDAVLIGMAGWPLRKFGSLAHSDVEYPSTEEDLQAKVAEELERLGEMFRRCAQPARRSVEWRSSPHFPNEVIAAQARAADLVIIGRDPLHPTLSIRTIRGPSSWRAVGRCWCCRAALIGCTHHAL